MAASYAWSSDGVAVLAGCHGGVVWAIVGMPGTTRTGRLWMAVSSYSRFPLLRLPPILPFLPLFLHLSRPHETRNYDNFPDLSKLQSLL